MHAMAIIAKHFNQRLHSNLQTMNAFVVTKKHNFVLENHNTHNFFCQKCWEDLPDPVTGLRGVPNRRACKGRGDHHTRGPHTWKGKRQDINSTDYCFTVQVSTTQVPTCIVDYSSLEQTDAQLEVELDKVEKMKKVVQNMHFFLNLILYFRLMLYVWCMQWMMRTPLTLWRSTGFHC